MRFILSTEPHIDGAQHVATLPVMQQPTPAPHMDALHLFALDGANTAGISAKDMKAINSTTLAWKM